MIGRRRSALVFSLLALAVPLPAFAVQTVTGGEQSLSVDVTLDRCGLLDNAITCRLNASWNSVDGADHYTVSVIRPDGSVNELGDIGATSATLSVEYIGAGSYAVQVSAWGLGPKPKLIATEQTQSDGDKTHRVRGFKIDEVSAAPTDSETGGDPAGEEVPPTVEDPTTCAEPEPSEDDPATDETAVTADSTETTAADPATTDGTTATTDEEPAEEPVCGAPAPTE